MLDDTDDDDDDNPDEPDIEEDAIETFTLLEVEAHQDETRLGPSKRTRLQ